MSSNRLRIAMAQTKPQSADVEGNVTQILALADHARDQLHADIVVFPELALCGNRLGDLVRRQEMEKAVRAGTARLRDTLTGITAVVGHPEYADGAIYNSATVFGEGASVAKYRKQCLSAPDDLRYFQPGTAATCVVEVSGTSVGITIGEDVQDNTILHRNKDAGADVLLNLTASPFYIGKSEVNSQALADYAKTSGLSIVQVNCTGGQDDVVFEGASLAVNAEGQVRAEAAAFRTEVCTCDIHNGSMHGEVPAHGESQKEATVYEALVRATRDYFDQNNFTGIVLGLSGGIDSALTLSIAVDAIGSGRVHAISMPSRYTAEISNTIAAAQVSTLEVSHEIIPIESVLSAYRETLESSFEVQTAELTEENLQARIRGNLLMALSNKFGYLLLATGNKSEAAVGYATLYGDTCGGFNPLADIYKTWVYRLARYRNTLGAAIPDDAVTRPPSAELRPDQNDSDSLPPYEELDAIIEAYIEHGRTIDDIVALGFNRLVIYKVIHLIHNAEYKRRQVPLGPKMTPYSFGSDLSYPICSDLPSDYVYS